MIIPETNMKEEAQKWMLGLNCSRCTEEKKRVVKKPRNKNCMYKEKTEDSKSQI
jgi:hypothetical protein